MLHQQITKTVCKIAVLIGCFAICMNLSATGVWSPIPPATIPGASATDVSNYFSTVVTTYNSNDHTVMATWLDINRIPTYAIWNGTSWSTRATNIPAATSLSSFAVPIYSTYDPTHNTIVTTWSDSNNNPFYAIWDGSSWTTPAVIPGDATANYFSVYTTYDAANQTVVATWADQISSPYYAVLKGNQWTTPATIIPGGYSAATVILSTYNTGNQTVVATWVNPDQTPTYAVWNGSSWIVPGTQIPNGGTVSDIVTVTPTYNPRDQTVIATWIEYADSNPVPMYAVLKGTSWVIEATSISNATTVEAMFFSTYDAANQTVMTTWLDDTATLMYAIWNGSSWTTPAQIPGSTNSSYLLLQPVYNSGSQSIIATWLGLGVVSSQVSYTPVFAIWNGTSWSTPTTSIPGASSVVPATSYAPFLYSTYDAANQTVMVTWLNTDGVATYALYTSSLAPPTSFSGYVTNNRFLTQNDRIYNLEWAPANDPSIIRYVLSRNGVPIYKTPASGPYHYADHNRNKKVTDVYTLVSQGKNGLESSPLTVTFKP